MENYDIIQSIGRGSFSKVFKVLRRADKKVFVSKEMEYGKMSDKEKQQLVAEVNILRDLRHPNIVKYYDRILDKENQKINIIMEYCEGGDLAQFLKKLKSSNQLLPEEVVLALTEIHRRKEGKVLHRDIKPANIFLDSQNNVKLGDFGLARMLAADSEFAETSVGTPYYMSPELIDERKYNEKSDIWACGCLIYEMCTLTPPFTASNYLSLAMKIKQGSFEKIDSKYSSELQRVLTWCLTVNENERPSVEDLLQIPYISLRQREKRLKENMQVLSKREEEIKKKEQLLSDWEKKLKQKESDMTLLKTCVRKGGENKENIAELSNLEWIQFSMKDQKSNQQMKFRKDYSEPSNLQKQKSFLGFYQK